MFLVAFVQVFFAPLVVSSRVFALLCFALLCLCFFDCEFCAEGTEKSNVFVGNGRPTRACYGLREMLSELPRIVKVPFGKVCRIRRRNNGMLY